MEIDEAEIRIDFEYTKGTCDRKLVSFWIVEDGIERFKGCSWTEEVEPKPDEFEGKYDADGVPSIFKRKIEWTDIIEAWKDEQMEAV